MYDGTRYEGGWQSGRPHGQGTIVLADGVSKYSGGWGNGKKHGKGSETNADGSIFTGTWEHGVKSDL